MTLLRMLFLVVAALATTTTHAFSHRAAVLADLFSYKINPQTVVLAGYSDNYAGFEGVDLRQANRTLFVKIGYAWLL